MASRVMRLIPVTTVKEIYYFAAWTEWMMNAIRQMTLVVRQSVFKMGEYALLTGLTTFVVRFFSFCFGVNLCT